MKSTRRRYGLVVVGFCLPWLIQNGTRSAEPTSGLAMSSAPRRASLVAELQRASLAPLRARTDPDTGYVTMLSGRFDFGRAEPGSEAAARGFLSSYADVFGFRFDLVDLRFAGVSEDLGGRVVTFRQDHGGVPVFEGEVVVGFDLTGAVIHVQNGHVPGLDSTPAPTLGRDQAVIRAGEALGGSFSGGEESARLVIVRGDRTAPGPRLAWEVRSFLAAPMGDWHVFVDARTGEVVRILDLLKRAGPACLPCNPKTDPDCGRVFHENPVDRLDDPSLRDIDNVDVAQEGCRLNNLTSPVHLDGFWATTSITADRIGPPYDAFRSASQHAVDEVNVYYHLNRSKERLNSLGFPGVMNFSIAVDAHDPTLGDNAHYVPSTKILEFGEGGVDDAQDGDVAYHEYGHAIQDNQVPGYGTTDEGGAAGEGFGDYWAASLTDDSFAPVLGVACLGSWNATSFNPYDGSVGSGCIRRLDGTKQYPRDLNFEVHDDGEMWSSALWSLRVDLGATVADRLIIKSHTFLTASARFLDAADALLSADQALNGGANAAAIHNAMKARGIPRTGAPASQGFNGSAPFHCETNHDYANGEYKECVFTQPGATRIRFHFSSFNTESGYDFTYVSDGDFLQVQALSGTPFGTGSGNSAAVAADTIVARFKADAVITRPGFVIDMVEYFQPVPVPAGRVPDGDQASGNPVIVSRAANGGITLTWSASCAPTDDDYEIYEGTLGAFASHVPVVCSTGGLTIWTLIPSAGDRYYLVVPRNPIAEGSYGKRSDGLERPPGTPACSIQSIAASCP